MPHHLEPAKTIYLVNPISGRGHLDSYARLYSQAFLQLGHNVTLLGATDGDTTAYLQRVSPDIAHRFQFVSFDRATSLLPKNEISRRSQMPLLQLMQLVWRDEGLLGLLSRTIRIPRRALLSHISPNMRTRYEQFERSLGRRLLHGPLGRWLNLSSYFDTGRISFTTLMTYVDAASRKAEHAAPDLVFFLYLDLMSEKDRRIAVLDGAGAPPWAGILFHPRAAHTTDATVENYFKSSRAKGGIFLVPAAISAYQAKVPHLHFGLAPDVADLERSAETTEIATEIRRRAGNRIVVLQIGSITAHKGIATLVDVIQMASADRFFFALVGEVHWESFGQDEPKLRRLFAHPPENMLLHQGYVAHERDYNNVLAASDIIYAVYKDFNSSSNSLTKAAGIGRPILVAENTLMGDRVLSSRIGGVAAAGNPHDILSELDRIASLSGDSFEFTSYQREHSLDKLKVILSDAVDRWLM